MSPHSLEKIARRASISIEKNAISLPDTRHCEQSEAIQKREPKGGKTVSLDDLGTFILTAKTTDEDTEEEVSANNILGLNFRFRINPDFKNEVSRAEIKPWK